ncbi:MAG: NADP-dependent malic enzyme [Magnetococcales bacterium]|nr:NADP-dependent malic enzyme [Magnetococcales bacterium]
MTKKRSDFDETALRYHRNPVPGKLAITATKPLINQRDLALAYSPGVAAACLEIADDPAEVASLTSRGNLVAVISDGSAVLGLGNIGPLAAKPVMEGKAVLFKKFAGIDVFDIEVNERDPDKLVEIIASLEPTFGGINLEDIKAPECFIVEQKLQERVNIPVFHDDQHGTAIISAAAVRNGLNLVKKDIGQVKLVAVGGGAAGIACLNLLMEMGLSRKNIYLCDSKGVIYKGRKEGMSAQKEEYAQETDARTLADIMEGTDIFLGVSGAGVLTADMVKTMARDPLILALANPDPEIRPEEARAARADAIIATGRSDYPNQVNNVLCFPFLFRGALDVGATSINLEMKLAAVNAIADLALEESNEDVASAYSGDVLTFGPEYLIPKPFDPRLILKISPAVAQAAMDSGVASRPIKDMKAYKEKINRFVCRCGMLMKPVVDMARNDPKRLVFGEGEEPRVLRAAQVLLDEGIAKPILVGRPDVMEKRIEQLGLKIKPERDFEVCNPQGDDRYRAYWQDYHTIMQRRGVTEADARIVLRTNSTVISALMVKRGEADAMICGTFQQYDWHLKHVVDVIGLREGVERPAAMVVMVMPNGTWFFCDTHVQPDPDADALADITLLAAEAVRQFGIDPNIALISHSNFGSSDIGSAVKMREAVRLLNERDPDLKVEGEMRANAALDPALRNRIFPNSRIEGKANLLVMPTLESANAAYNLLTVMGDGLPVGPILLGAALPAHILVPAVNARGIVNIASLAVAQVQNWKKSPM